MELQGNCWGHLFFFILFYKIGCTFFFIDLLSNCFLEHKRTNGKRANRGRISNLRVTSQVVVKCLAVSFPAPKDHLLSVIFECNMLYTLIFVFYGRNFLYVSVCGHDEYVKAYSFSASASVVGFSPVCSFSY